VRKLKSANRWKHHFSATWQSCEVRGGGRRGGGLGRAEEEKSHGGSGEERKMSRRRRKLDLTQKMHRRRLKFRKLSRRGVFYKVEGEKRGRERGGEKFVDREGAMGGKDFSQKNREKK